MAQANDNPKQNDGVAMEQLDRTETADEVLKPAYDKVDEFGAHTKTDPKEIALVRRLDIFCLVRPLFSFQREHGSSTMRT